MTTMFEDSARTLTKLREAWAYLGTFINEFDVLHDEIMDFANKGAMSSIGPPTHYDTPNIITDEQSNLMLSTIKKGGYVFVNLNNNNVPAKTPYTSVPRWVIVTDLSPEGNAAVMAEPWWSATHKPLKRYKQFVWEIVILAKSGA